MTKLLAKLSRIVVVAVAGLVLASAVKANPLLFSNVTALQNQGFSKVDLFSNPGTTLFGPQLSFSVDVTGTLPVGKIDALRITYTEANSPAIVQSFEIPVFGSIPPPFTLVFTLTSPNANAQGVAATLLVDLLNSSPDFVYPSGQQADHTVDAYTYRFNVATPVPEPSTMMMAGIGLSLMFRKRVRQNRP
jgi:hypothetical protein